MCESSDNPILNPLFSEKLIVELRRIQSELQSNLSFKRIKELSKAEEALKKKLGLKV